MKASGFVKYIDSSGKKKHIDGEISIDESHLQLLKVCGDVHFDSMQLDELKVEGSIEGRQIKSALMKIDGDIDVMDIVSKQFKVCGNVSANHLVADEFKLDGSMDCKKIKASNVSLCCTGKTSISEIVADNLQIQKSAKENNTKGILFNFFRANTLKDFSVEIESIRSKDLMLSGIFVNKIIGKNVKLENGCRVNKLLCAKKPIISNDSLVKDLVVDEKNVFS